MSIDRALIGLTGLGATWVMWLLAALSVIGVAIIVERALTLWSARDNVTLLRGELRQLLSRGDLTRARHRLEESPSFEARIAHAALSAEGADSAEERMLAECQMSRLAMERRLAFVGTLGNNAPFIGLLGTVIGIVRAFAELSTSSGRVSAGLMSEIGEALVATAVGLLVALPAVAAFNALSRVIRARVGQGEVLAREVLAYLKQ